MSNSMIILGSGNGTTTTFKSSIIPTHWAEEKVSNKRPRFKSGNAYIGRALPNGTLYSHKPKREIRTWNTYHSEETGEVTAYPVYY